MITTNNTNTKYAYCKVTFENGEEHIYWDVTEEELLLKLSEEETLKYGEAWKGIGYERVGFGTHKPHTLFEVR